MLEVSAWVNDEQDTDSKELYTAYLIIEPVSEDAYHRVGLAWAEGRLPEPCGWEIKYVKII